MKTIDILDFSGGKNTYDDQVLAKENQCVATSLNVWAPRRALTKMGGLSVVASFTASGAGATFPWMAYEPNVGDSLTLFYRLFITSNTSYSPFGSNNLTDSLTPLGYTTGSVSISGANLISATGHGTSWATHASALDRFRINASAATWYQVASVEDDTHLTLGSAIPSAVASGTGYMVQPGLSRAEMAHAVLNGNLFMSTTADQMHIINTGGVTRSSDAPRVAFLAVFKNYLFGFRSPTAEDRLYWSAVGDGTSWPANSSADVDKGRGKGTGMIPFGNELIVFKQRSMYKVVGDVFDSSNPTFGIYPISTPPYFLFNSNWSACVHKGVLFFGSRGSIYAYQHGSNSIERISKTYQDDVGDTLGNLNELAGTDQRIAGVSYQDYYIIKGLFDSSANQDIAGLIDENGAWWKIRSTNATTSTSPFANGTRFAILPTTSTRPKLLTHTSAAPRVMEWQLFTPSASADYVDSPVGGDHSAIAIQGVWISKEFNVEFSHFGKMVIYLAKQTAGNLTVEWSIDQGAFVSNSVDMTQGRGNLIRRTLNINQRGSTIQIRVSNNTSGQTYKIYGIRIYYEPDTEARLA